MPTSNEAQNQLKSIEALVHRIEKLADPALTATAKELVQLLMDLHGAGIERMLEIINQTATSGPSIIDALGRDDLVRSLLLLYGFHPIALKSRVQQALEKTRPYLKSHGGNVELAGIDDSGAVTLRLEGNCHGCPSSSATLKLAVEEAIYDAAPDVTAIIVQGSIEEASPALGFVRCRVWETARRTRTSNAIKSDGKTFLGWMQCLPERCERRKSAGAIFCSAGLTRRCTRTTTLVPAAASRSKAPDSKARYSNARFAASTTTSCEPDAAWI
jgi:Fe-S cluster biogenesis protein NfuA